MISASDSHPDVDILLESLEPACCIMNVYGASKGNCERNVLNQGQYVQIAGKTVKLDIRIVGDEYYSVKWAEDIYAAWTVFVASVGGSRV